MALDLPDPRPGAIWLHACSMGEVGSVVPLIRSFCADGEEVHLTVVTRTGFTRAMRELCTPEATAGRVTASYLPWDLPGRIDRMIGHLAPRALLLVETEFWPGMLASCRRRGIPVVGVNTRISDRSFPRYRATALLWRRWLAPVRLFLAQSAIDAERLRALGIEAERVVETGNLKLAVSPPEVDAEALRRRIDPGGRRPILLLASSHAGEEEVVVRHLSRLLEIAPDLLLLIVPRHPERFDQAAESCRTLGFPPVRWSEGVAVDARRSVMVVDAMGVLAGLFAIADLVVVGGSIADCGGHNPLEAAVCGRGVITGPYVQNFRSVMRQLATAGGAVVAEDRQALGDVLVEMVRHPDRLRRLHAHAARWMAQQGDVLARVRAQCDRWIPPRA
ncbi:MAG: 3-deoxy-D-manno-octulosonic acid transferase [Zetaproteobacteria bacterium]|nr:MAG: 3-deoxy-D-manno-octulosonic acid transferase [Zetaproteobacteria bacterium]